MNYDFSVLNDKEFEQLVCDGLNSWQNLDLQDFKAGIDQGIDLRYNSSGNKNFIIVQAKHYLKSGYKKLLNDEQMNFEVQIDALFSQTYSK